MPHRKADKKKPEQLGLFDGRGCSENTPAQPSVRVPLDFTQLSNEEILARLPQAGLADVRKLCCEVHRRPIPSAIPALQSLWQRFIGFGMTEPLLEQELIIQTFGALGTQEAKAALRAILLSEFFPPPMLKEALSAAAALKMHFSTKFVTQYLEAEDPMVRQMAFNLASHSSLPEDDLISGLTDPYPEIRIAAAVALAENGYLSAKGPLLAELKRSPNPSIIEALSSIADDDVIVILGRLAKNIEIHEDQITRILKELDNPKATAVLKTIKSHL